MLLEGRAVNRYAPFFHGLDQVDFPPRGIHFASKLKVGRTDGKANSAVNAVEFVRFVFQNSGALH